MAFSAVGRKKVAAHLFVLLVNIIVLALAARVNQFQEFFYVADLFPLAMSIITLVFLTVMIGLDWNTNSSFTGLPQVEIGVFGFLSIFWLSFNAFSSSRWMAIPMNCAEIPAEFDDVVGWCKDLNALKAFVWVEFLAIFFTVVLTIRYTVSQSNQGRKHIWKGPLSRYDPNAKSENTLSWGNGYPSNDYPFAGQTSNMAQADVNANASVPVDNYNAGAMANYPASPLFDANANYNFNAQANYNANANANGHYNANYYNGASNEFMQFNEKAY